MKKKWTALLLELVICLALLPACGVNSTPEAPTPQSPESTAQPEQPAEEPEEPKQPEEPKEENNAGTEFLALLQEEWNNGFIEGEGPNHTYFDSRWGAREAFIRNGVVYIADVEGYGNQWYCSYDLASKEFQKAPFSFNNWHDNASRYFMDDNFYFLYRTFGYAESEYTQELQMYNYSGELLRSYPYSSFYFLFEKGILAMTTPYNSNPDVLLSHDLEKIAEIPVPQLEIEHGLKEDVVFNLESNPTFAVDGTVYTVAYGNGTSYLYRLNMDIYEWKNMGEWDASYNRISVFCGKYISCSDGVYDCITGE